MCIANAGARKRNKYSFFKPLSRVNALYSLSSDGLKDLGALLKLMAFKLAHYH